MKISKAGALAFAVMSAFPVAAIAQSSLTLYGVVDVGVRQDNPKLAGAPSTFAVVSGHQNGSRFGFRGNESLGGGLSAVFALESGFNIDSGTSAQGSRLFGRQAYVGLRSATLGTLVAGRNPIFSSGTGDFHMLEKIDPFRITFGIASLGSTYSSIALRADNSILWQSPKWAGFQGGIGYSTAVDGAEAAGSSNNNTLITSALSYSNGPLYVGLFYDVISPTNAQERPVASGGLGATDNQTHLMLGGTYDFKVVEVHAAYWWENDQFGFTATRIPTAAESPTKRTADATGWMLGLTVPIGQFRFFGDYQSRDGDQQGRFEGDRTVWAVGGRYALSRRTNLYASYANSTGRASLSTSNTYNSSQLAFGMRHGF
jgi:predicted porin